MEEAKPRRTRRKTTVQSAEPETPLESAVPTAEVVEDAPASAPTAQGADVVGEDPNENMSAAPPASDEEPQEAGSDPSSI